MGSKPNNNNVLPKKSKLNMASLNSDRSDQTSSNSKVLKDAPPEQSSGSNADIDTSPANRETKCSGHESRTRGKSQESINQTKTDSVKSKNAESSLNNEQRVDTFITDPAPVQSFITNNVAFNITSSCYNPIVLQNLGNPINYQYDPQFQLTNNFNMHCMCRSDGTRAESYNTSDVDRDRKRLWEWRAWGRTKYGRSYDRLKEKNNDCILTVMSYNVLAQNLLSSHQYLYKRHNPEALTWEQRWKNLLYEIKQQNADILCLQEVQFTHLQSYHSQLKKLGYKGIFKQRTGNSTIDGCAIYYKTSVVNLINYTTIEYNQPNVFVLNRDNVAIVAKFAPKQNIENEFVVATTHLLYNPRREDIRLAQTQVLLTEIDRMSFKRTQERKAHHLPIIITGDFNFMPYSPVYQLITQGSLRYENLVNRSLSPVNSNSTQGNVTGKYFLPASLGITDQCQHAELIEQRSKKDVIEELQHVYLYHSERSSNYNETKNYDRGLFSSGVLSHHLAIKSAYEHRRGHDVEATTFQNKWITVDYIFYSGLKDTNGLIIEDKLNLLSRYILPTSQQLQGVTIPNKAVGSDHFSLVVKFKLNP